MEYLWTKKFKDMTPEEKKQAKELYKYADMLLLYYSQFVDAKKKDDFIKKGWYKNMSFVKNTPDEIIKLAGVSHNDLLKAAKEYQDNNGADTEFTKDFEQRIVELKSKVKNNPNKLKLIWKIIMAVAVLIILISIFAPSNQKEIPVYNGIKTKIIGYRLEIKANKELTEQEVLDIFIKKISKKEKIYHMFTVIEPSGKGYTITPTGWVRYGVINNDGFPIENEKQFYIGQEKNGEYTVIHAKESESEPVVVNIENLSPEDIKKRNEYIKHIRELYSELQIMKNNPEFLQKSYAWQGSKEWLEKLEYVRNQYNDTYNLGVYVFAGDLWQLGLAYGSYNRHNDKNELKYIQHKEKEFNEFMELTEPEDKKKQREQVVNQATKHYNQLILEQYNKLQQIKNSANFLAKGNNSPEIKKWMGEFNEMQIMFPDDFVNSMSVTINDLIKTADEYYKNNGADTEFTLKIKSKINNLK